MPVEVYNVSTKKPDVAQVVLSELYTPEQPITFSDVQEAFTCNLRLATAGDLGADRVRFMMGMRCVLAPVDSFMAVSPVAGQCHFVAGKEKVTAGPSMVVRYPNDVKLNARWANIDARSCACR